MGCCISATATATATTDKKNEPDSGKKTPVPPPVAVVEEETVVKEVLSETTLVTSLNNDDDKTTNKIPEEEEEEKPGAVDAAPDPVSTENGSAEPVKGSEVSEVCSLSESLLSIVSGYDEEEVKQRKLHGVRQRSPAKYRDRVMVNNYPTTRRTDMSPRKRNMEGGGGEGAGSVRLGVSGTGQRDPSERSERRRSRSPAINRPVMVGQNRNHYDNGGVMMKKGQSPGRVRPNPSKNGSEQDCHHQWPSHTRENDNSTCNDSFENPLVALECFIFL